MRKQESVHLHGLLRDVAGYLGLGPGEYHEDNEAYQKYGALGVMPTSLHRSSREHDAAVLAMANGINIATGEKEELSEVAEEVLEQVPPEREEAYSVLQEHAYQEETEYGGTFTVVELNEEILEEIGPEPNHVLERLDGGFVDAEGYKPGDQVRLIV
ncbi:MAG: UPF0058 family protein [Candidatus Nanohaloarchaea archaeon]